MHTYNIPQVIYHGTYEDNLSSIFEEGLIPSRDVFNSEPSVWMTYPSPTYFLDPEDKQVILKVNTEGLDPSLFESFDTKRLGKVIRTFKYSGTIPSENLKLNRTYKELSGEDLDEFIKLKRKTDKSVVEEKGVPRFKRNLGSDSGSEVF